MQKKVDDIWEWLKYRLKVKGYTFVDLARTHGVDVTSFTKLKIQPMPKNERILAVLLGLEPWDIWSDRYDTAHNPIRISTRYQGHKHFLNNNRNKPKVNGKDRRRNCHETKA